MQRSEEVPSVEPLVSIAWLKEQLDKKNSNVFLLDASYDPFRDIQLVKEEYLKAHIPDAVFFNLRECRDAGFAFGPNMIPSSQVFEQYCGSIGLDNTMHIVIYDNNPRGLFSAPRAYWMFRAFGHDKVSILNGGLVKWRQDGHETSSGDTQRPPKTFHATMNKNYLKTYDDVVQIVGSGGKDAQIVDARPPGPFQSGHISKSKNIPFFSALNELPNSTVKDKEGLREIFAAQGIDLTRPTIFSCGSGGSACVLFFAAQLLGKAPPDIAVYNGSWAEWEPRSKDQPGLIERTTA